MNPPSSPQSLVQLVLWGGLAIGLVFGAVGQWSHFCVRGAIADWMVFRGRARLLTWLLAVTVAALGT
ncbi:MAG: YeeE/YedE family protein, partial [Ramlibacter sp.]